MKIPKELIFLGLAQNVDVVEDTDAEEEEITCLDLKGTSYRERPRAASDRRVWIMATDPESIDAPPGQSTLYLIKAPFTRALVEDPDHDPSETALDAFYLWHNREADRTFEVDAPESIKAYFGHITRIVYASDKKEPRGKIAEYEHDFYEDSGEPPFIFFDTENPDDAKAAVIYGGTTRITERGII
jgi:hypothetical protein